MKTLKKLFEAKPSYMKWGNKKLADLTGLKEKTVQFYKNTVEFRDMKKTYISSIC